MTMNLTGREKKAAVIGAIIVGLVVLYAYVVAPLARAWSWRGNDLKPRLRQITELRERARRQGSLVRTRNVLVSRLGALTCPEDLAVQKRPDAAMPGSGESAADAEGGNPGETEKEPSPAEETADPAAVAVEQNSGTGSSGVCLAAHLERIAKTSGVNIKRISPRKRASAGKSNKHFGAVALKVNIESNIENLIKLLYAIEKGERLIRVESIQLRRDLKKGGNVATTLDVVGYEAIAG